MPPQEREQSAAKRVILAARRRIAGGAWALLTHREADLQAREPGLRHDGEDAREELHRHLLPLGHLVDPRGLCGGDCVAELLRDGGVERGRLLHVAEDLFPFKGREGGGGGW